MEQRSRRSSRQSPGKEFLRKRSRKGDRMVTRTMTVVNDFGLHARAAAAMVGTLGAFSSEIMVRQGERSANARSIIDLLLLGASSGSVIEVTAAGDDEELAIAAITALVIEGFGETGSERGN